LPSSALTADQPIREFSVGLPAGTHAVMVFAGHLESISLNENSCLLPDYAKIHASPKQTATTHTAKTLGASDRHNLTSQTNIYIENIMRKHPLILIGVFFFISCDKDDNLDSANDKFLELAYDNNYQYPDGFYYEKNLIGSVYYENTVSIKPIDERGNIWIELNTDDKEQAKTWSDLSNEYSSVDREIIKEKETEKYFEIVRVNIKNVNDTILSRVHRSDYFVSLYNRFTDIYTVGIYNGEMTSNKIKELIEYLWSCGTLSIYDKVVKSSITDKEGEFEHKIQSLRTVYGDFGIHDIIYVYDNGFKLDKATKILTIKRVLIKEIEGNYNEGW
jgi:hypothetical protein